MDPGRITCGRTGRPVTSSPPYKFLLGRGNIFLFLLLPGRVGMVEVDEEEGVEAEIRGRWREWETVPGQGR